MKTPADIIHSDGSITRFKPTALTLTAQIEANAKKWQQFAEADKRIQKALGPSMKLYKQLEELHFTRITIPPPTEAYTSAPASNTAAPLPTPTLAPTLPAVSPAPVVAEPAQVEPVVVSNTHTPTLPKASNRKQKIAVLHSNITLDKVQKLLDTVGMGRRFTKPGEWAAAFKALCESGVLKGNAPEVTRWAVERHYVGAESKETIKKVWSGEYTQPEQFNNKEQQTVFRNVKRLAEKLLNIR